MAYLWEVVSEELPDSRGLQHIDAHAGDVGQLLRPAKQTTKIQPDAEGLFANS